MAVLQCICMDVSAMYMRVCVCVLVGQPCYVLLCCSQQCVKALASTHTVYGDRVGCMLRGPQSLLW